MKILSWNWRGLENPRTIRALKQISSYSSHIVFLCETKLCDNVNVWKSIMNVGPLTNIHNVNCFTSGGEKVRGLTFLWRKDVTLYILDSNQNLIEFYITPNNIIPNNSANNMHWRGTQMYGYPKRNKTNSHLQLNQ